MTDQAAAICAHPRVSVIVPLYRCAEYVRECLKSLVAQTMGDFEAICVDDASPDESVAIARDEVGVDTRFRFCSLPENRGLSAARNAGIEAARGDILVFLDSDDYLAENALALIVERFDRQNLDDLYFNARSFYEDRAAYRISVEDFTQRPDFPEVTTGRELFAFFEERGQFHPQAALRAVRRAFLLEQGISFYEDILHEDLLFTFQTLAQSRRTSFLNEPIYQRRLRCGSITVVPRHTMRNIEGHMVYARYVQQWLIDHAAEVDGRFAAAASHAVNRYLDLCATWYFEEIEEGEKRAYLASLAPADRVWFEMFIAQRAALLGEFLQSCTYRAGVAVTALPRRVRDALACLRRDR